MALLASVAKPVCVPAGGVVSPADIPAVLCLIPPPRTYKPSFFLAKCVKMCYLEDDH